MPHLTLHALENEFAGREPALVSALTEAVVAVYGPWVTLRRSLTATADLSYVWQAEQAEHSPHGRPAHSGQQVD